MKTIYKLKVAIILLLSFKAYPQADDKKAVLDLLAKSKAMYDNMAEYQMESNYALFTTYTSNNITENYKGIFIKKGKQSYMKINRTEFVNLDNQSLHIDNESKLIDYKNNAGKKDAIYDFYQFVNKFSKYTKQEEGNLIKCTLTSPDITFVPYSKIEIYLNSQTLEITKQVFYLLLTSEYKDNSGKTKKDYPRLEVHFNNQTKELSPQYKTKFSLASYLTVNGAKYVLSKEYQGYTIINSQN